MAWYNISALYAGGLVMIKKKNNQISFAQLQVSGCIDKTYWLYKVNKIIGWRPVQEKLLRKHRERKLDV